MRLAAFFILSSFTATAFGYPAIGDMAEYAGTNTKANGQKVSAYAKFEIFDYVAERKQFLQREETAVGGIEQTVTAFVPENDYLTRAQILELLGKCKEMGGKPGNTTVPAGKFQTCEYAIDNDDSEGKIWLADVPYGAVQADTVSKDDKSRTVLKLKSFHQNQ
jgi:hypothetical protein